MGILAAQSAEVGVSMEGISKYYEIFRKEEAGGEPTVFEELCLLIPEFLRISDFGLAKKYDPILEQAQLYIQTRDVFTFALYTFFLLFIASMFIVLVTPPSSFLFFSLLGVSLFVSVAVIAYPILMASRIKMSIIGQAPLAILYMVISLRVNPTLENALTFAARNVSGSIGQELKKILWQVQTRTYTSVAEAIYDYSSRIKSWAPGFSDSLYLVANSSEQPTEEERLRTLEKAIQFSLESTRSIMERFARNLSMPVMATNAMGVILPVLGLVMAPVAAIFSSSTNMSIILTAVYCIVLPTILLGLIAGILSTRPGSFSVIDIRLHPEAHDVGKIRVLGMAIPGIVVGIIAFFVFSSPTLFIVFSQGFSTITTPTMEATDSLKTLPLLVGVGLGVGLWMFISTNNITKIVKEIRSIEREFSTALYQLSNVMQQGMPLEQALQQAAYALQGTKSSEFFRVSVENIESFGYPPSMAILDPKVGAIRFFPSSLVRNILEILLSAAQRSPIATANSAQGISLYLQNIQKVEDKIEDLLSESVTSMKFQSYILIPMISGVVVGLSQMITQILIKVGEQIQNAFAGTSVGFASAGMIGGLLNIRGAVPPAYLQLVVGFYTLEMLVLLGAFAGGLEKGLEDRSGVMVEIGSLVTVGTIIYAAVAAFVALFFSGLAAAVLA